MLIGYSMQPVTAVSLSAGTWLTTDNGDACFDREPARKARFGWPAAKTAITDYVTITATLANASPVRIFAALGLGIPAGTRVEFFGNAGTLMGGNTTGQRAITMPDGSVGLYAVGDAAPSAQASVRFRIFNDANGVAWATEGDPVDVGELVAMPAVDVTHSSDWSRDIQDPSETNMTRGSQRNIVARSRYRTLDVPFTASSAADVFGGALADGMDLEKLQQALSGDARSLVVLRETPYLVASYGVGRIAGIRHLGGDYFDATLTHEEIPAR